MAGELSFWQALLIGAFGGVAVKAIEFINDQFVMPLVVRHRTQEHEAMLIIEQLMDKVQDAHSHVAELQNTLYAGSVEGRWPNSKSEILEYPEAERLLSSTKVLVKFHYGAERKLELSRKTRGLALLIFEYATFLSSHVLKNYQRVNDNVFAGAIEELHHASMIYNQIRHGYQIYRKGRVFEPDIGEGDESDESLDSVYEEE